MAVSIKETCCFLDVHSILRYIMARERFSPLHWRHNEHDGVSNHQPHGCLLKRLFRRRSKKTSKLRVTGLCVGNSSGPVNSPHKGPVTEKMSPFDDVIMAVLALHLSPVHWPVIWIFNVFDDIYQCWWNLQLGNDLATSHHLNEYFATRLIKISFKWYSGKRSQGMSYSK